MEIPKKQLEAKQSARVSLEFLPSSYASSLLMDMLLFYIFCFANQLFVNHYFTYRVGKILTIPLSFPNSRMHHTALLLLTFSQNPKTAEMHIHLHRYPRFPHIWVILQLRVIRHIQKIILQHL